MVNGAIDRELIEMVTWGDRRVNSLDDLSQLYDLEHAPMVRLATLLLRNQQRAEEVVHDAFITLYERRTVVERPGAYLRRTVINNCHDVQRRGSAEKRKLELVSRSTAPSVIGLPPELDETWQALDAVTPKQRTALILRFYEDLGINAIAEAMGERPGTVKSLVHRGLKTLRTELEQ